MYTHNPCKITPLVFEIIKMISIKNALKKKTEQTLNKFFQKKIPNPKLPSSFRNLIICFSSFFNKIDSCIERSFGNLADLVFESDLQTKKR